MICMLIHFVFVAQGRDLLFLVSVNVIQSPFTLQHFQFAVFVSCGFLKRTALLASQMTVSNLVIRRQSFARLREKR
jgi:hypothetical protein